MSENSTSEATETAPRLDTMGRRIGGRASNGGRLVVDDGIATLVPILTPEVQATILHRITRGDTLTEICASDDMPDRGSVSEYARGNPDFASRLARAREDWSDAQADYLLQIADDSRNDYIEKLGKDGEVVGHVVDHEHISRSQCRINTRLRMMERFSPAWRPKGADVNVGVSVQVQVLVESSPLPAIDAPVLPEDAG